jgi:hypothetical protein
MVFDPGECQDCGRTDYRERPGISETLLSTEELKDLIARKLKSSGSGSSR